MFLRFASRWRDALAGIALSSMLLSTAPVQAEAGAPSINGTRAVAAVPVVISAASATGAENMCASGPDRLERDPVLREQTLPTSDGAIGYYRFGRGDPIVLITGYRATLEEWDGDFLTALAKRHEVIVFDNRGVGQSRATGSSFGIEDMAHDTATLIRALGLQHPTLVGWSMGGLVAQQLAVDQPELLGRLVLLSTQAPGAHGTPAAPTVMATLDGRSPHHFADVMNVLFPPAARPVALRCFVDAMFRPLDYQAAPFPEAIAVTQAHVLDDWRSNERVYERLQRLSLPTLIIAGRQDDVLSPANAQALAKAIPHARLAWFDNAGHALMYQFPNALARLIGGAP